MKHPPSWKRWLADWLASWRTPDADSGTGAESVQPPPSPIGPPPELRQKRNARRETLYGVIREGMIRAGVLSGSYKFKVLTLDAEGLTHHVLVDMHDEALRQLQGGPGALEAGIRQLAQDRARLTVKSVYWRSTGPAAPPPAPTPTPASHTHEEITHDELAALQEALGARTSLRTSAGAPVDFQPTQPMVRRPRRADHPLSDTQMGDLG